MLIFIIFSIFNYTYGLDSIIYKTDRVKSGQGLYQALKSISIDNEQSLEIINSLRDYVEFSKLKAGDQISVKLEGLRVIEFSYSQKPSDIHQVKRKKDKWIYQFISKPTFWKKRLVRGNLGRDSILTNSLKKQGLSSAIANEVIQVLSCKVNFRTSTRQTDTYNILLKDRYFKNKIIETKILYISYKGKVAGNHKSYYFNDELGSTYNAHYTKDGLALINSALRYPLKKLHIRSGFGYRIHPVTGKRKMHSGIDLRAKKGTKVRAVAPGKVIISGYSIYAGNKVAIRHSDGSSSYYYHLDKRSVKIGQWVRVHQAIGTVGATGRVTGPHLHFGFKSSRGKWINPLNKRMIATPKLKGKKLSSLRFQVELIENELYIHEKRPVFNYVLAGTNRFFDNYNLFLFSVKRT